MVREPRFGILVLGRGGWFELGEFVAGGGGSGQDADWEVRSLVDGVGGLEACLRME